jgi:hypothetical protein
VLIRRREACALIASAAWGVPPAIQVAAMGVGAAKYKYAGVAMAHDAKEKPDGPVIAVEIRLNSYDPKTGLPSRELIERVATAASKQGAERLILNGRTCYDGHLDRDALTSKCIALNQAGRLCMSKQLGLRYRNGRGEFGGNALEMEMMMLRTNAELVGVAFDPADAQAAKADVVNFFARHQNRMDCIFIREWDSVPYALLAAELVRRQWQGWLVQSPANADARKALTQLFKV